MRIIKDTIQSKIDFWTRPHLSIESADERRQARLLRVFLIVFLLASFTMAAIPYAPIQRRIIIAACHGIFWGLYFLSNSRHYKLAGLFLVIILSTPPILLTIIGLNPSDSLRWLAMSILTGGLWLTPKVVSAIYLGQLAVILSLPKYQEYISYDMLSETIIYLTVVFGLVVVWSVIKNIEIRNRQQADRALAKLNQDLEGQVEDRTRELFKANQKLTTEITERKHAVEALRTSHERFLAVLDGIDATIYVAEMETYEILFMNKYMIESFGRDMTGEICWNVFRGESGPCPHCTNDKLIDGNGKPTDVYCWQGKNPITGKWYNNYDRAIEWTDGRLVRLQIATDITDAKKMEEELRQAQKMEALGNLAGGIAHDFNNLLMGIQGRASLMAVDMDTLHPQQEHIEAIEEYVHSATNLTKQLLGLARGGKYEVKPVDMNDLVMASADMFGRTRKEIRIHTKTQPAPLVVEADKRQIEQVLLNIFVNAWQAMPDGGELYLETKIVTLDDTYYRPYEVKPGRYAMVSVTDTGSGMDEATRQRIFDPFFTTKEKSRGTGLGLASAYGIVKNHGGMITVDSEVGYGTTFNIYLLKSDKEAHQEVAPTGKIIQGSETIPLVDDEEMIIDVSKAILEKLGYRVVIAKGGEPAIDAVQRIGGDIDLVILDLIMPGMDGSKVFDRIREIKPNMPVLLSSGYSLNDQADDILQRGCNGFIQKPFNISKLSQKVRKILDKAKS
jgi:signal transduction histidine kinase/CheY-like chemotaxis protein